MARILVVEDDYASRELLSVCLRVEGFDVQVSGDLATSRSTMKETAPDAVLLDIRLGKEDGLELAQWMRLQPAFQKTPVIAVTAHAMITERARILQAGCNEYISKPVDLTVLLERLKHWLNREGLV